MLTIYYEKSTLLRREMRHFTFTFHILCQIYIKLMSRQIVRKQRSDVRFPSKFNLTSFRAVFILESVTPTWIGFNPLLVLPEFWSNNTESFAGSSRNEGNLAQINRPTTLRSCVKLIHASIRVAYNLAQDFSIKSKSYMNLHYFSQ